MRKIILLTLFGCLLIVVLVAAPQYQNSYPQIEIEVSENAVNSTVEKKSNSPFEGESIKIIAIRSFFRENEWRPIDNLTSNGYEIKSVLPSGNIFFVILEKEN